jgi:hypothetical protein
MTELEARMKVVNIMRSWVGGYEGGAIHKEILNTYNNHRPLAQGYVVKSWDAWCATTVSAAFIKAGMTSIAPTECSCPRMINLYKNIGRWVEADNYVPAPADIVMYDWQDNGVGDNVGTADHVGVVESSDGKNIVIIEGNMSNGVGRRTIQVNARYIRGYCCPDFAAFVKGMPSSPQAQIDSTDYSALINKAVAVGDYKAAAQYEQKRNEKIDAMIAAGMTGYEKTYKYASYLNSSSATLKVGDEVKLSNGAQYTNGNAIPGWVINSKLYVRELRGDDVVFSTLKTGAITGVANKKYFNQSGGASSYKVQVTASALNVRSGPGINYYINSVIRDQGIYEITETKNGWGKISDNSGWISLAYTKKV